MGLLSGLFGGQKQAGKTTFDKTKIFPYLKQVGVTEKFDSFVGKTFSLSTDVKPYLIEAEAKVGGKVVKMGLIEAEAFPDVKLNFGLDVGEHFIQVSRELLASFSGVALANLGEIAFQNFFKWLSKNPVMTKKLDTGLNAIDCPGKDYIGNVLFMQNVMQQIQKQSGSSLLVLPVTREHILFVPETGRHILEENRQGVEELYAKHPQPLSRFLYSFGGSGYKVEDIFVPTNVKSVYGL